MHHKDLQEALEIDEGILATRVAPQGFGYLTGYSIGLKPVVKYPVKHSNHLDSWSDSFDEVNFTLEEFNAMKGTGWARTGKLVKEECNDDA